MQSGYLKDRRVSDAAGIIPFIIGSINQAPLKGRGLYIDQPLVRYTPPRVNLKTGAYASRVAETAAVVKTALNKADIKLVDSIRSVTGKESYTPLAKILGAFKTYEKALVDFLNTHKEKLANNNGVISTMIVDDLRKAKKGEDDDTAFKRKLQGLVKQGKEMTEDALGDTLLESNWHLLNESFSGLDEFDHFYSRYIATKDYRDDFKTLKTTMNTNSLNAFIHVVHMYHAYYDAFLDGNELNAVAEKTVDKTWRDAAFPVKPEASDKCVPDTSHEQKANSIVDGLVWDILLERFEIFASIIDHVFNEVAGPGSDQVRHSADEFIRMGIIAAMDHLFVSKSGNKTREEIAKATYTDAPSLLIQEVVLIHDKFNAAIANFLHADWIVQLEPIDPKADSRSGSVIQAAKAEKDALWKKITRSIFNSDVASADGLSVDDSKISDLSINSTAMFLSQAVKQISAPLIKDKSKSLLTAKEGRNSITGFKRTQERDVLREHIIDSMTKKIRTTAGAATVEDIREVFAAKVITALYNQDAYFAALFLLPAGDTADRHKLASNTLKQIGSVFSKSDTSKTESSDAAVIKWLKPSVTPTEPVTTTSLFITDVADFKEKFKLSPALKKAYDKAVTQAANTNKGPKQQPKKAAPQQPKQAQKQTQPQPQKGQQKGNQRPQSAPPPQKQNNKKGGKKGGGR